MSAPAPPLIVLGVRRSGTTLLRVMLDRNTRLAVPDESYFVPQLASRHRGGVEPTEFVEDLRRLPTLREWGVSPDAVGARLRPDMPTGEAIAAVFEAYAETRGKERWGDKTPLYMQHLRTLERLFPHAYFVHLVRDGRDAALSFLSMPKGIMTEGWGHPRDAAGFACQWKTEVVDARALGARLGPRRYLELRYEELVDRPEEALRRVCAFAHLPFEPEMLGYAGTLDLSAKPHQQRLQQPPTPGVRDWRADMSAEDVRAFEEVAGDVLAQLGYEVQSSDAAVGLGARLRLASYRGRTGAWRLAGTATQVSPLWRRRHPRL